MAKTPKKLAAKRGGKKAPGKVTKKTAAANRPKQRKPSKRAQNSALPHYDPTDVAFSQPGKPGQGEHYDPSIVPKHPTVEEQYRADHAAQAARAAAVDWPDPPARARTKVFGKPPAWWTRFRSAMTGLFVTRAAAKADPDHTVGEKVER